MFHVKHFRFSLQRASTVSRETKLGQRDERRGLSRDVCELLPVRCVEGTMALAFIAILIHSQAASIPSAQGRSNYP